ncbi:unnamed protein product [Acanthoscelides obtectus]|uniref:Uncharacterized protein n=1 Tax=Acanthoscelides obtectus TaxID=200917 RepID=A0A9P0K0Y6_ACAOB|nr:unnamed protein product [Acanthoscelides obtectus]CAK1666055.1 hypothetical protein AOBTE_LOCUS25131 [Acanthoscelides obtectus]
MEPKVRAELTDAAYRGYQYFYPGSVKACASITAIGFYTLMKTHNNVLQLPYSSIRNARRSLEKSLSSK